jgi:hypothetical protein
MKAMKGRDNQAMGVKVSVKRRALNGHNNSKNLSAKLLQY